MTPLRFDADARWSCAACARCCRRGQVAVTAAEADRYRKAGLPRLLGHAAAPGEPFVSTRHGLLIRQAADGACVFLSPAGRCRIHEELGEDAKPLACRLFPFSFHAGEAGTIVTATAACPSAALGQGSRLGEQTILLRRLAREWSGTARPRPAAARLDAKRRLAPDTLATLRDVLASLLLRPGPGGAPDLLANLGLVARRLEDLTRWRVARLTDDAFAEYLALTGRHAVEAAPPDGPRKAAGSARWLFRGVLLAVLATRYRFSDPRPGLLSRVATSAGLLLHLHRVGPPAADFDLRDVSRARVELSRPGVHEPVLAWLRAAVRTAGASNRPVVDELAVSVAVLHAGLVLAAAQAARRGATEVEPEDLASALPAAADVTHAEGAMASLLATSAGGLEGLFFFADGGLVGAR